MNKQIPILDITKQKNIHITQEKNNIKINIDKSTPEPVFINYQELKLSNFKNLSLVINININSNTNFFLADNFDLLSNNYNNKTIQTNINLNKNSKLNYIRHTELNNKNNLTHICDINIKNAAQANFFDLHRHSGNFSSKTNISLQQDYAQIDYFGLDQLGNQAQQNNFLIITHDAPHTKSSQKFRGIYSDQSSGNFHGQVIINKHAQKSDAYQLYKALLLDTKASAQVEPHMEIFNHDIKASHGATIGSLDPEALFYLRSRGLNKKVSQEILVKAFAQDILAHIPTNNLKNLFQQNYE